MKNDGLGYTAQASLAARATLPEGDDGLVVLAAAQDVEQVEQLRLGARCGFSLAGKAQALAT